MKYLDQCNNEKMYWYYSGKYFVATALTKQKEISKEEFHKAIQGLEYTVSSLTKITMYREGN